MVGASNHSWNGGEVRCQERTSSPAHQVRPLQTLPGARTWLVSRFPCFVLSALPSQNMSTCNTLDNQLCFQRLRIKREDLEHRRFFLHPGQVAAPVQSSWFFCCCFYRPCCKILWWLLHHHYLHDIYQLNPLHQKYHVWDNCHYPNVISANPLTKLNNTLIWDSSESVAKHEDLDRQTLQIGKPKT